MESYKIIREKAIKRNNDCEYLLSVIMNKKDFNYQQYNTVIEEKNELSINYLDTKAKKRKMRNNRLNVLRITEALFWSIAFALIVKLLGDNLLPVVQQFGGESLGIVTMITTSLTSGVGCIFLSFLIDSILSSKIIKRLKQNKKYKKIVEELTIYKSKIDIKNKEKAEMLEEHNRLVMEENDIKEQIAGNTSLINLLNSLIEEDDKMEDVSKSIKKRVRENN